MKVLLGGHQFLLYYFCWTNNFSNGLLMVFPRLPFLILNVDLHEKSPSCIHHEADSGWLLLIIGTCCNSLEWFHYLLLDITDHCYHLTFITHFTKIKACCITGHAIARFIVSKWANQSFFMPCKLLGKYWILFKLVFLLLVIHTFVSC